MKKRHAVFGVIALSLVLAAALVCAQPKLEGGPCEGTEENPNGCPRVWVEVTPAFYEESPADHTYIKFLRGSGRWRSFPCFGACRGGAELADTESPTWEQNEKIIQFMADMEPCKWPKHVYLIVGVCHQLANRGLFHTGRIVKNARMYEWSSFIYQTYGACFFPLEDYCMGNCLKESPLPGAWRPGAPPACTPPKKPEAAPGKPDAEHRLYWEHFMNPELTFEDEKQMEAQMKSYRHELLRLHITQRLGQRYVSDFLTLLSEGQDALLKEKRPLDTRLYEAKRLTDEIIDAYNALFNKYLARFRAKMPRDLYERFFGLTADDKIDMRIFMPVQ